MKIKKTLRHFLELLEEMQKGKNRGKHCRCVFGNTLFNIRDIAELNNINPESFVIRDQWKEIFKLKK